MSATFHLNIKGWADDVRRLDKRMAAKTYPQLLKQQGKLFVQDLILATPPFDQATINGPLNAQKKIGERAVETDVRRMFRPMPKIVTFTQGDKKQGVFARRYIRLGQYDKLGEMLRRLGIPNGGVVEEATEGDNRRNRNDKGRIPRKVGRPIIVIKGRTISTLVTKLKGHVGKLKAGWKKAARHFAAAVPDWIGRHSMAGMVKDDSKALNKPSITVGNLSAFGPKVEFEIVQFCLKKREGSMQKQIETLVNSAIKNP